jgi:hypothetical protein
MFDRAAAGLAREEAPAVNRGFRQRAAPLHRRHALCLADVRPLAAAVVAVVVAAGEAHGEHCGLNGRRQEAEMRPMSTPTSSPRLGLIAPLPR